MVEVILTPGGKFEQYRYRTSKSYSDLFGLKLDEFFNFIFETYVLTRLPSSTIPWGYLILLHFF